MAKAKSPARSKALAKTEKKILITGGTGFELDATTFSGDVRSDLPITTRGSTDADGRKTKRSLSGTYGDGSAILELSSFSGSIVIAKK